MKNQLEQFDLKIFNVDYEWTSAKLLGIFISVVLLSLGAPFWFNVLRNLTNLRSKIMQTEEDERKKRRKA